MPVYTAQYVYPTSMELSAIDQDLLPVLSATVNPIFRNFPYKEVDAALVEWEQRDSYFGLQQARTTEGEYPVITPNPISTFQFAPGRYGEHADITGEEIETRKGFGQVNMPINIKDLVIERQEMTATRQFQRMAYIIWTCLANNQYTILDKQGTLIKRDSIGLQTYVAQTLWSSHSTATPLADFRAVKLLHRGHSITFDNRAEAWMNTNTFNAMIANANTNDLGGRRSTGLETVEGLDAYNSFIALKDNLPKIVEYDEGYLDDNKNFQLFIPDGVCIVIGKRLNGAPIGDFALTRNADNGNSSAPLLRVVEHGLKENEKPPAKIQVFRGWNGGPRFYFGNAVCVMSGLI